MLYGIDVCLCVRCGLSLIVMLRCSLVSDVVVCSSCYVVAYVVACCGVLLCDVCC